MKNYSILMPTQYTHLFFYAVYMDYAYSQKYQTNNVEDINMNLINGGKKLKNHSINYDFEWK